MTSILKAEYFTDSPDDQRWIRAKFLSKEYVVKLGTEDYIDKKCFKKADKFKSMWDHKNWQTLPAKILNHKLKPEEANSCEIELPLEPVWISRSRINNERTDGSNFDFRQIAKFEDGVQVFWYRIRGQPVISLPVKGFNLSVKGLPNANG